MFGKSIKIFKLFGFEVKVDLSWIVIAVLLSWALATFQFPFQLGGLSSATYWWMGIGGAIGLFVSIVFHELWHSLIARRYGLQMKGITLFIFGGVSEMTDEPASAKVEFWMAVAGPFSSLVLAVVFHFFAWTVSGGQVVPSLSPLSAPPVLSAGESPVVAVLSYLGFLNVLLAIFNILPAFPLDGGRVLRAIIWGFNRDIVKATRISSWFGSAFALGLIAVGLYLVLLGALGGLWFALIGWFLWTAARSSYQQVLVRKGLEGITVKKLMEAKPVTVPRALSIERFVEDYIYKHTYKLYPVLDGDRLAGCATLQKVKDIPRSEWATRTVGEIAGGCSPDDTIGPDATATEALTQMSRAGLSRLMVIEGNRLIGIIALKDMLNFLNAKLQLGQ